MESQEQNITSELYNSITRVIFLLWSYEVKSRKLISNILSTWNWKRSLVNYAQIFFHLRFMLKFWSPWKLELSRIEIDLSPTAIDLEIAQLEIVSLFIKQVQSIVHDYKCHCII